MSRVAQQAIAKYVVGGRVQPHAATLARSTVPGPPRRSWVPKNSQADPLLLVPIPLGALAANGPDAWYAHGNYYISLARK